MLTGSRVWVYKLLRSVRFQAFSNVHVIAAWGCDVRENELSWGCFLTVCAEFLATQQLHHLTRWDGLTCKWRMRTVKCWAGAVTGVLCGCELRLVGCARKLCEAAMDEVWWTLNVQQQLWNEVIERSFEISVLLCSVIKLHILELNSTRPKHTCAAIMLFVSTFQVDGLSWQRRAAYFHWYFKTFHVWRLLCALKKFDFMWGEKQQVQNSCIHFSVVYISHVDIHNTNLSTVILLLLLINLFIESFPSKFFTKHKKQKQHW